MLKPGGVVIFTFSNRMFYHKAIAAWRDASGYARCQLVKQYFQAVQVGGRPVRSTPCWNVTYLVGAWLRLDGSPSIHKSKLLVNDVYGGTALSSEPEIPTSAQRWWDWTATPPD